MFLRRAFMRKTPANSVLASIPLKWGSWLKWAILALIEVIICLWADFVNPTTINFRIK
jgi:hypothetical protein